MITVIYRIITRPILATLNNSESYISVMRNEHDEVAERKIREWQEFVIKNKDIFQQIAKGLEKRKK